MKCGSFSPKLEHSVCCLQSACLKTYFLELETGAHLTRHQLDMTHASLWLRLALPGHLPRRSTARPPCRVIFPAFKMR